VRVSRVAKGAAAVLGAVLVAGGILAVTAGGSHAAATPHSGAAPSTTSSSPPTTSSVSPGGWRPVAPATTVPVQTPVQQQYDQGFAQGFSSAANKAMMERAGILQLPSPSLGGGWPDLAVSETPDGWAGEFVNGLLDIEFARQSRGALGAWLIAAEAPDLMPGIPTAFQDRSLYVSLMEPGITGQPSPMPSATQWSAYAAEGVRWSVSGLEVQLDPQWQQMIDAGWQPPDIRSAVEDVSGLLTVQHGRVVTKTPFSLVLQVGSAHWNEGYGTVLVSNWKLS
jgi:hypothetical protein